MLVDTPQVGSSASKEEISLGIQGTCDVLPVFEGTEAAANAEASILHRNLDI